MITVKVNELRQNGQSFENALLEKAKILAEKSTNALADETVKIIRDKIKEGTKRSNSTGTLAESFFKLKIRGGYGVGDITYLNKHAPYWRHINYGSFAIGANWRHKVKTGMFFPGVAAPDSQYAGEGNQGPDRWMAVAGFKSQYSFIPTKEIKAHNYIEHTVAEILRKMPHIINGIK